MNEYKIKIENLLRLFLKDPGRMIHLAINMTGGKKKCYICKRTFHHFKKYKRGSRDVSEFIRMTECTGSDVDNFSCMYCGSMDRERHLFMYFDELKIWDLMMHSSILHFAPETCLKRRLKEICKGQYIMADLNPVRDDMVKIDICNIPYPDNTFDVVICNHVLEHVSDYNQGIREIFRVLKPSGTAITQVPYSTLLSRHFFDENINTDRLRACFYGEAEHLRLFSRDQLFMEFEEAGFQLQTVSSRSLFTRDLSSYYGVNHSEDLVRIRKP